MSDNPSLTRRTAILSLGALAASGTVGATVHQIDRTEWERAVARNKRLADEINAHPAGRTRADHPDYPRLDREERELQKQWWAAEDELMRLPAPDLPAAIADFRRVAGGGSHV